MARVSTQESLAKKIEKAQNNVAMLKTKLASAEKELKDLKEKQYAIENKELVDAISKSGKSYEEIMKFLEN